MCVYMLFVKTGSHAAYSVEYFAVENDEAEISYAFLLCSKTGHMIKAKHNIT